MTNRLDHVGLWSPKQNLTLLIHSFIQQMSQTHHITPSPLPMFSLVCINEPMTISAGARKILISNYSLCIALIISLVLGESYSETQFYFLSSLKITVSQMSYTLFPYSKNMKDFFCQLCFLFAPRIHPPSVVD